MFDTITERWTIIWFAPDGDHRKKFTDETKARKFAASEDVVDWNPLMEHEIATVKTEVISL